MVGLRLVLSAEAGWPIWLTMAAMSWALRPRPRPSSAPTPTATVRICPSCPFAICCDECRDHVADLVPEHSRELRLVLQPVEQAASDEHLAPGEGEGVDRLRVAEQVEVEVANIGALLRVAVVDEPLPDLLDEPAALGSSGSTSPPILLAISGAAWSPRLISWSTLMATCCFSPVTGLTWVWLM